MDPTFHYFLDHFTIPVCLIGQIESNCSEKFQNCSFRIDYWVPLEQDLKFLYTCSKTISGFIVSELVVGSGEQEICSHSSHVW